MNPYYDREKLSNLCWGMLFYLLGLDGEKKLVLKKIPSSARTPSDRLIRRIVRLLSENKEDSQISERIEIRRKLVFELQNVLDARSPKSAAPRLGLECPRCNEHRKANDSSRNGYSRDPFKEIARSHRPEIAFAAIAYLVRSHSYFFCRPRPERNYNTAKAPLNDIFQAAQLAFRLYYSSPESHLKRYTQSDYLKKVKEEKASSTKAWESPFFIWWILELAEIWRGNIYRQIGHIEKAERHYRHAQNRFDRLSKEPLNVAVPHLTEPENERSRHFTNPTLIKALFERSKILFDKGLFLESMMNQLRCLSYFLQGADESEKDKKDLLADIARTLIFLDVTRKQYVWDKETITRIFGFPKPIPRRSILTAPISPKRFIRHLAGLGLNDRMVSAQIFGRLAFILYILRRGAMLPFSEKTKAKSANQLKEWLSPYVAVFKDLKLKKQPVLAQYTETLLSGRRAAGGRGGMVFSENIERQLAFRLRENIMGSSGKKTALNKEPFYGAVLNTITQNIGNIFTTPKQLHRFVMREGYKRRRISGSLSGDCLADSLKKNECFPPTSNIIDKIVVLRRWQSFNPKIPRPVGADVRGGGYFLFWRGKGIVIDPGYDFIQNFYEEGFSLEDIDAIVVTHSHPDHDDDLPSLITLIHEWNEYHGKMGYPQDKIIKTDIFLNESAHLKFSDWLKSSSKAGIKRVIELPLVVWNAASKTSAENIRGGNTILNLKSEYQFDLEVVPAWHDDVIGKTAAVGLKFHLYDASTEKKVGIVGFTGDTGAYGMNLAKGEKKAIDIRDQYEECDVLVAHLGDVKLREMSTVNGDCICSCINDMVPEWFSDARGGKPSARSVGQGRVEAFLELMTILDIAPQEHLEAVIEEKKGRIITVGNALHNFIKTGNTKIREFSRYKPFQDKLVSLIPAEDPNSIRNLFFKHMGEVAPARSKWDYHLAEWQKAYILIGYLCSVSLVEWYYKYHLGIFGLLGLHRRISENPTGIAHNKIFIVGELPEELASYRHHIARLLNARETRGTRGRTFSYTGDIGLHVGLPTGKSGKLDPKIRCTFCTSNSDNLFKKSHPNYHHPDKVLETALKRLESSMVYLCTEYDHHIEQQENPYDFLSSTNIEVY